MVVLSVGLQAPTGAKEIAEKLGIELNEYNFCSTNIFSPLESSKPGIYVCGAFSSPKDIPETVAGASGASAKASSVIASERGKLVSKKEYPPERNILDEEPKIGVFVCHCGINIGGVVDVPEVTEFAKTLPNVVYAERNLYTCSQDTQDRIKEKIKEHNLNRVIVASCTPRTHEPLFRETTAEGGLNPYLFEMANIRDQCSWVHMHEPEKATEKAKDLLEMVVAKAGLLEPLQKTSLPVTPKGLVIGGGLSGMTAALELADQGFETYIVEREEELGGNLRRIQYTLGGEDPKANLDSIIKKVNENEKIHVYTASEIKNIEGYVGNFETTIEKDGKEETLDHGAVIVATGGQEYKPSEYNYGKDERVLTQLELEEKISKEGIPSGSNTIVMIQCVGSRNEERPYCSRVCCSQAIKNALKIKELNPDANVFVLYKDIRTYGFREEYYTKAMEESVIFIRYDDDNKPEVTDDLKVAVFDPVLKEKILIEPDLLVLSSAVLPQPDNQVLAQMLKVPLSKDKFFLEAHMKLRPVDFATEGVFLCGLAHSPKCIDESIAQACGASCRAVTVLSKDEIEAEAITSSIDESICTGCGTCIFNCPYNAIAKDEEGIVRVTSVLCKGCGVCGATCPEKAITMHHYSDEQLIAQATAALMEMM